jgi:WD40 repeat protein
VRFQSVRHSIVSNQSPFVSGSYDKTHHVWDVETGQLVAGPFDGYKECVRSIAYSSDGKRVVSASEHRALCTRDVENGQFVVGGPFHGHIGRVWSIEYLPDGKRLVAGLDDKTLRGMSRPGICLRLVLSTVWIQIFSCCDRASNGWSSDTSSKASRLILFGYHLTSEKACPIRTTQLSSVVTEPD